MADEYAATERVFSLLALLLGGQEYTRLEVFSLVTLYNQQDEKRANDRMFERDLAFLERMGCTITRRRQGREPASYQMKVPPHWIKKNK